MLGHLHEVDDFVKGAFGMVGVDEGQPIKLRVCRYEQVNKLAYERSMHLAVNQLDFLQMVW